MYNTFPDFRGWSQFPLTVDVIYQPLLALQLSSHLNKHRLLHLENVIQRINSNSPISRWPRLPKIRKLAKQKRNCNYRRSADNEINTISTTGFHASAIKKLISSENQDAKFLLWFRYCRPAILLQYKVWYLCSTWIYYCLKTGGSKDGYLCAKRSAGSYQQHVNKPITQIIVSHQLCWRLV